MNSNLFVTGVSKDSLNQNSRIFLARVQPMGNVDWLITYSSADDQYPAHISPDAANNRLLICGVHLYPNNPDLFVAAINENGQQAWATTYDHSGNADVGLRVFEESGQIIVSGTSQTSQFDWDIVSWVYSDNGDYISEDRSAGVGTNADELSDGILQNGFLNLVGRTIAGFQTQAKLIVLDAANNYLWQDVYTQNGLQDGFSAVTADMLGALTAVGYTTPMPNNQDLLLRKYNQNGQLIWHTTHNAFGQNDQAMKVVQDEEGNYLVLANVTQGAQQDVYLYCFEGSTGSFMWEQPIANSPNENEIALNLEANIYGDVYVTYAVNGDAKTKTYNYSEVNYPIDYEPFSKGSLILESHGRIYHQDGSEYAQIKYATFGFAHEYFFTDDFFSTRLWDYTNDGVANDFIQRIDFSFEGSQPTTIGHLVEYTRPEHFNYYLDQQTFEQQKAYDVIAYPAIYTGIDAYITTNSEGFKLVFVLKDSTASLSDIALNINGATGTFLHSGDVHIPTVKGDIIWRKPFSYFIGGDTLDDNLTHYDIDPNGQLRFSNSGELQYPYIVQIKTGIGATYGVAAINNMDWSTFFGGDGDDGSFDMTVDPANGDLFVAGFTHSVYFPLDIGDLPMVLNGKYQGLVAKFNQNAVLQWATVIGSSTNNGFNSHRVKGVGLYDNLLNIGKEVHLVGEYRGNLAPDKALSITQNAYQQTNSNTQTNSELYISTLDNIGGTRLLLTPFGGAGHETVNALDITPDGVLYFVGSTTQANNGGHIATSSQNAPTNHTLPVYDPADGSFFTLTHPSPGNKLGYVAALDLSTYQLVYASIITGGGTQGTTAFQELFDIHFTGYGASYCGRGIAHAKLGNFSANVSRFSSGLNQFLSDWPNLEYFSSVQWAQDFGWVYFGITQNNNEAIHAPYASQYQSVNGEAFILRINEGFVNWKTYFGLSSSQQDIWNGYSFSPIDFWSNGTANGDGLLPGRGKLTYNSQTKTLFASASALDYNSPTFFRQGYFFENQNASTPLDMREDIYLAAFSYQANHSNPILDKFNWGTMYGSNSNSTGPGFHIGREFLGDVHSYTLANQTYVLTTSTSYGMVGSTTSNVDFYPVTNLGFPGSWYKNQTNTFSSADIAITRFVVSDIQVDLNIEEKVIDTKQIHIYPNPTNGSIKVQLTNKAINQIDIVDINGRLMFSQTYTDATPEIELNLSNLASGMYFINVNNTYHAKICKL